MRTAVTWSIFAMVVCALGGCCCSGTGARVTTLPKPRLGSLTRARQRRKPANPKQADAQTVLAWATYGVPESE